MDTGRHRDPIERARWRTWTFVVASAPVAALVYGSAVHAHGPSIVATRRVSLAVALVALFVYVVGRERSVHRLGARLAEQRIENAQVATRSNELPREHDGGALLHGAADGVAVFDASLRLLEFNESMAALCGVDEEDALGAYAPAVLRFLAPDGASFSDEDHPMRAAFRGGVARTGVELRLGVAGGGERWVGGTFSPILDESGHTRVVLAILRDITEAKEMQAMQRDFVSIVSHELRAPLTAIKGFAATLRQRGESLDAQTRASFLDTVGEQADRLARLVDDLLQVSKIDARRLRLDLSAVNLNETFNRLATQFRSRWTRPMTLDLPEHLPDLRADRAKLEEVLINLVDNAIKYSPEGAPVRVSARARGEEIEVAVEDSGYGIAPEDTPKLFQRFQRLSGPATRDVGGSGLGLYIVKGLLEAQGGRVWVESSLGSGSTFRFTLPAAIETGRSSCDQVEIGA